MILIEKYDPEKIFTAVYEDTKTKLFYVKRFMIEATERKMDFIGEEEKNRLVLLSGDKYPRLDVTFDMKLKTKGTEKEEITVHEFIGVKGFKAKGKRISAHAVKKIEFLEPIQIEEPSQEIGEEETREENPEPTIVNEQAEVEMKNEKVKVKSEKRREKSEKGKVKSEEEKAEDKKIEDTGDAVQMELPL
jgi:topoisomerase-4 subunit A